ncbi:hypothetical protein [Methylorubrum suomiense]|uniref:Uncharacterized protein n=1 Tax=Methylorubrum suomiense TaxID=144191 RepID=A0ABQ4V317_9HYPH|nr:hypothetical protein [Methylorubrum suomiense]GJE78053.1 hypothetical protein BGCPKDLD_4664 [Methylorubrum suomiense]
MCGFIIKNSNGRYVAYPGRASSYTSNVLNARRFATREDAQAECCGNEWVIDLADL